MDQIKVSLALLSKAESSIEMYVSQVSNAIRYKQFEIPSVDEGTIANQEIAARLRTIVNEAARTISVAKTWTFLMPVSRYMELCRDNMSEKDPIPNVHGCLHHLLHGDDILFMTGHTEVLAIARKLPRFKNWPTTVIDPLELAN